MQKYQDHVTDQYGNSQRGAVVLIKTAAGETATIYSDDGVTTKTNPITTGADGGVEFYAANGDYVLYVNGISTTEFTLLDVTEASTATPTSSSTVVGETDGMVKRFAVDDLVPLVSVFLYMTEAQIADVQAETALLDVTAALQSAHAASRGVYYPRGKYKISLTEGQYLFKGTSGKYRFIGDDAMIYDTSTYTVNGSFTQIFWVDDTDSLTVEGINYLGPAIPTPATDHGYIGASFVRATTGAKNITVDASIENARHGIHSGDYSTPALGYCERFRGHLDCKMVGYPLALYLPRDVEMSVYGEGTHRCAYLAGAKHVRLDAKFKDQYVAPIQVFLTDAMTGAGTSYGAEDVIIRATDMGSTTFVANSHCAGLSLSRVDPGTAFQDIEFNVYVKGTDTVATTLGGVVVTSGANISQPSYTYNWEPTIYLRNIKIRGVVDRSEQTATEHGSGEIYFYTLDTGAHFATVQGLDVSSFQYIPGSGSKPRGFWFFAPGLVGPAKFDNSYFGAETPFYYATNATSTGLFSNCTLRGSYSGTSDSPYLSAATFVGCTIANQAYQPFTNKKFINTTVQGAGADVKFAMTELTLSGASTTWAGGLANQSIILGVSGYVTEEITGATGYTVGDGSTAARFVNTNTLTAGSTFSVSNGTDTSPKVQVGTGNVVVTAKTSNFTGGKIRLFVSYITVSAPTS